MRKKNSSEDPFLEIAFQAEVSRYEDDDYEEVAWSHCEEDPKTRARTLEQLRNMIYERGQCRPRRVDDAYLLRFLRCRRSIPALAHKLMVRYEQFRQANAYLYDTEVFGPQKVLNVYAGVVPESPKHGRITLMKFGRWDTEVATAADLVRVALIMDEIVTLQPRLQILGVTIIVDLEGLGLRHVRRLSSTVASQVVSLMGVSYPLLLHGLHIMNYGIFLSTFFYFFKQFIPASVWGKIHFHRDLASLHKLIEPKYLPEEYEGQSGRSVGFEEWILKIDKYKDDFLVRELRELGFTVNN